MTARRQKVVSDIKNFRKKETLKPPTVRLFRLTKRTGIQKIRMPSRRRQPRVFDEQKWLLRYLEKTFSAKRSLSSRREVFLNLLNKINEDDQTLVPEKKEQLPFLEFKKELPGAGETSRLEEPTLSEVDSGLEIDLEEKFLAGLVNDQSEIIDSLMIELEDEQEEGRAADNFEPSSGESKIFLKDASNTTFFQKPGRAKEFLVFLHRKPAFLIASLVFILLVPLLGFLGEGLKTKDAAMADAFRGQDYLMSAKEAIFEGDFQEAGQNFGGALAALNQAEGKIKSLAGNVLSWLDYLPFFDKAKDSNNILLAAKNISLAGQNLSFSLATLEPQISAVFGKDNRASGTLTERLVVLKKNIAASLGYLREAQKNIGGVKEDSLPASLGISFFQVKDQFDAALNVFSKAPEFLDNLIAILGHERSRKYLILFQNSAELRATGGFIGSYGLLDLDRGELKNILVDNVFNPDGQLQAKIVPPEPIQKISANWSMHDANWFADFPTSAQKVAAFFEKTGGPTVDGVIAVTPALLTRILELTGSVYLPDYNLEITADNFQEKVQYKVEADYDRAENKPKKILADLAPLLLDKLARLAQKEPVKVLGVLAQSLNEKDVLLYFRDEATQEFVAKQGWAGELKATTGDFSMLVNSNICGYKTDYVVEQEVKHLVRISASGEVFDTIKIKRSHLGGQTAYEWFNKVNADYFRLYVPVGSQLLWAAGNTVEEVEAPVDYQAQDYKIDADLAEVEKSKVATEFGVDVFIENGKTVFGGWSYVSPGEETEILLQYKLPFTLDFSDSQPDVFSLVLQKQPGQENSLVEVMIDFPESEEIITSQVPDGGREEKNIFRYAGNFSSDKFFGFVLAEK